LHENGNSYYFHVWLFALLLPFQNNRASLSLPVLKLYMLQPLLTKKPFPFRFILRHSWALPLVALLLWASWETPEMHHYVRPVEVTVWQLAPLPSPAAAQTLATQLATEPGVSACSVSPRTNCVAFVYHPAEASLTALYAAVRRHGVQVIDNPPAPTVAPAIRQCPVPTGYLIVLDQIRFALNLRRLFTSA
jgi:hypothetical protein